MKENIYSGKRERVSRFYNTLKAYVGDNRIFKGGDVLYVSTKNNDLFDVIIFADGIHNFCELYRAKQEEKYLPVSKAANLAAFAGEDIRVQSDDVVDAFTADIPYFKNIIVNDAEVSKTITMKAAERITLDGVVLSGGKDGVNGKLTYAAKELELKNISAKENATLYNAFEGYQKTDDPNYSGIKKVVADNLDIDCPSLTHNIINVYTPANGAEIIVKNSKFNLTVDKTNPLRLANYLNAENVHVTFENVEWNYENGLTQNDWGWAGLVIFQPAASDVALNGDISKIATWKFTFKNCKYNGVKVTENNFGEHNQVLYFYNIGNSNKVSEPVGAEIIFE